MTISVIIPAHNEAENLAETLAAVAMNSGNREVIVVDAMSSDDTASIAQQNGACLLRSPRRQRAAQMNLAASQATGELLLFLHADTSLPPAAFQVIELAMLNPRVVGGGFARCYKSRSWFLKMTCTLAEVRSRVSGWFLGDQAIFARRKAFALVGGFDEALDVFEDLNFSQRLRRVGRTVTLRPPVISSGRRFEAAGPIQTTWADFWLTIDYLRDSRATAFNERTQQNPH